MSKTTTKLKILTCYINPKKKAVIPTHIKNYVIVKYIIQKPITLFP